MNFRQFYLGCLSHASYYLGSDGESAVIDPQRDVEQYIAEAAANGQKIKYVIETHLHADFVSGHTELAAKTGAQIIYGEKADTKFPTLKVRDGGVLGVGTIKLTFRETPGHTPEGICVIAEDGCSDADLRTNDERADERVRAPLKVFTGDTLFIGDVGRPDLIGSAGFTADEMAAMLYDSIYEKILPLPDDAEIYPAHGAGSLCGKNMSKETWSTLGEQRRSNYALQPMTQDEFVKIVAAEQTEAPRYFSHSVAKNLAGPRSLDELSRPLTMSSQELADFSGVIIDVRSAADYGRGHVPGSINIGLGGQFASWAGTMLVIDAPLALVAESADQVDEAVMRLARVGHENVIGFVLFCDYIGDQNLTPQVDPSYANDYLRSGRNAQFIDVRRTGEYAGGHADGAESRPLTDLATGLDGLDPAAPTYVICQGGYRSSIATSILESVGFSELYNVTGGTAAWSVAGLPTTDQKTM
ncbi:MAG: MBL fold metallo-hydrolase [Pyrinomonadaceae bacterium]